MPPIRFRKGLADLPVTETDEVVRNGLATSVAGMWASRGPSQLDCYRQRVGVFAAASKNFSCPRLSNKIQASLFGQETQLQAFKACPLRQAAAAYLRATGRSELRPAEITERVPRARARDAVGDESRLFLEGGKRLSVSGRAGRRSCPCRPLHK